MKNQIVYKQQIVAGGGTVTIPLTDAIEVIECYTSGAVVLAANVNLAYSGTPYAGQTLWVLLNLSSLTIGANTVTIFGESITAALIEDLDYLWIKAIYSTTAGKFIVTAFPNFDGTTFITSSYIKDENITTAKIKDDNVTLAKLADFAARGYMIRGGAAGAPEAFDAKTSGQLVMGDGTDVSSIAMSGDVTITGAGVTTIGAGKVTPSMLAFSLASYLEVTKTLSSAEVLTLYSANANTGFEFIATPGSNKYIELISVTAMQNYGTTTYASPGTLNLECNGVSLWTFPEVALVEATADVVNQGTRVDSPVIALNTAIKLHIGTSNPITGDGTITVKAVYRICDLV